MKDKKMTAAMKEQIALNYFGSDELPEGISQDELSILAKNLDKLPSEMCRCKIAAEL